MSDRPIPERKAVKSALRELGLSNRQVNGLLRHGWRSLVGETEAELNEVNEALQALRASMDAE